MMLVDSNVLLDLITGDPVWAEWSVDRLDVAARSGPLVINDVIFAELSVRYARIEALELFLSEAGLELVPIPRPALFLAAKAFQNYRKAGGQRSGVLPDFFIGAHAAVSNITLLTRDARRYRTYFPTVKLVAPDSVGE
ncbi:MAG: type II toxin-antitoxin system VapC family toxin [Mesorhizobium sp.]